MNQDLKLNLKIKMKEGAFLPEYKTSGSAGADIRAFLDEPVVIKSFERSLVPTGLFLEIPTGYEVQIRPRSGLALKNGIFVLNSPGTIDSDYRGELCVILANFGKEDFVVNNGDRIAQMVFAPVVCPDFVVVSDVSITERGEGGFGSTGVK